MSSSGSIRPRERPLGGLVAEVVQAPTGEFDGQVVRFETFGEGGGGDEGSAETVDGPGNVEATALGGLAVAEQKAGADLDGGAPGSPVQTRHVAAAQVGQLVDQVGGVDPELENSHSLDSLVGRDRVRRVLGVFWEP